MKIIDVGEVEDDVHKFPYNNTVRDCSQSIIASDLKYRCAPSKNENCILCCKQYDNEDCFYCSEYDDCWIKDCSLITMTQVVIFLLFVFGILFVIIMYFRTCNRTTNARLSRHSILENERNGQLSEQVSSPCCTIKNLRDRPPSYSEACSAPPLYGSPLNRVSMLEAPPMYPETPKSSEKLPHSIDPSSSAFVHHI